MSDTEYLSTSTNNISTNIEAVMLLTLLTMIRVLKLHTLHTLLTLLTLLALLCGFMGFRVKQVGLGEWSAMTTRAPEIAT